MPAASTSARSSDASVLQAKKPLTSLQMLAGSKGKSLLLLLMGAFTAAAWLPLVVGDRICSNV
jgi:hypothetical protein